MADDAAQTPVLAIAAAETHIGGASAAVALPATVWHLLGESGAGRVYIQGDGDELPPHRLAVTLGAVSADGAVRQHQVATLFLTRPTEAAEPPEEPPYCGHPGNAEYGAGGGGGIPDEHPADEPPGGVDEDDPGDRDTDTSDAEHPGDKPGAATPVSSGDCEGDGGEPDEESQP